MARRRTGYVLSEDMEEARVQILIAAEASFQRYSIAKTTMDDIAKEAGVSRPTIYRYFEDRDALISAMVERRSRSLFARAGAHLRKRPTFAEQLVDGVIYLVKRGRKDDVIRLIVSPRGVGTATKLLGTSCLATRLNLEMWSPLIEEARNRGEVRANLTDAQICDWITLVELILVVRMDFGGESDRDHRKMLSNFLLPGIIVLAPDPV
ncbi:TetR family transcriptional regulator [Rhodococcus sp. 14-2686-1-2]|nr:MULTISPECIES: TetR/AcrR family transcriptional regulator [unclassified Rhodococcus (in: high G+C Gram-positive bacteria)]OZE90754.1 TetR family transcriptional regulator [Rhodococcus sp. 15-1189-1-1a]OZF07727.1 TetR family transcriptional regulator [Rhodococcus sp. 14-2686-1-2]